MTTPRDESSRWFRERPRSDASARIFCIPYSGCGASMYRRWPTSYRGIELVRLQPPGRENRFREPIIASYQEFAAAAADAVEPYLDVPYAFFGHCGSALAAYETTVELERRGCPTAGCLFISSQIAPQSQPTGRWLTLNRHELNEELTKLIVASGGTPLPELSDVYLDVLEADIAVNKRYVVSTPQRVKAPIRTIGWRDDVEVDHRRMGGWSACGAATAVVLQGPHERFMEGPAELFETFVGGLPISTGG